MSGVDGSCDCNNFKHNCNMYDKSSVTPCAVGVLILTFSLHPVASVCNSLAEDRKQTSKFLSKNVDYIFFPSPLFSLCIFFSGLYCFVLSFYFLNFNKIMIKKMQILSWPDYILIKELLP